MRIAATLARSIFVLMFVFIIESVESQEMATIEFIESSDQSEFGSMVLSFFPQTEFSLTDEDSEHSIQFRISSIKPVSGEWLLEKTSSFSKEEEFVRSWFLAYKDVKDLSKFENVLSTSSLQRAEEQYASGERPRDWELDAFDQYSDVRLLGLARYGYIHLLFVENGRF